MTGSLFSAISGLNTHQTALDVESNNIANVNTVGFKSDTVTFADLMYQEGVGTGSINPDIFKAQQQGTLKQTGNTYDFAIQGEGFFTVTDQDDPTDIYYTRAGNFKMDSTGLLQTMDNMNIMGVQPTVTGDMITNEFEKYVGTGVIDEDESLSTVNVYSTDYTKTALSTGTSGENLKTVSANINDITQLSYEYDKALSLYGTNPIEGDAATYQKNQVIFPLTTDTTGYDLSITIESTTYEQEFDTDAETTLKKFADQISSHIGMSASVDTTTGELTIDSLIPAKKVNVTGASVNGQPIIINETQTALGSGKQLVDELYSKLEDLIIVNGGTLAKNTSTITKAVGNTQLELGTIQLNMNTLGVSENMFGELSLENDILFLNDGQAKYAVAQVPPVFFANSYELSPKGNNRYVETKNSGEAVYIENKSKVINGVLELSTADLSESLVNLMVYQRSFDANSKSIMTSDQMLQTAIQLKKQ